MRLDELVELYIEFFSIHGLPVNIHHTDQTDAGLLLEMQKSTHNKLDGFLHNKYCHHRFIDQPLIHGKVIIGIGVANKLSSLMKGEQKDEL